MSTSPTLLERFRAGDLRALSRLLSLIEDEHPQAAALLAVSSRCAICVLIGRQAGQIGFDRLWAARYIEPGAAQCKRR